MIFDLFDFLPKGITIFLIRNPVNEEEVLKIIGQIAPRGSYSRYDILLTDCDERETERSKHLTFLVEQKMMPSL